MLSTNNHMLSAPATGPLLLLPGLSAKARHQARTTHERKQQRVVCGELSEAQDLGLSCHQVIEGDIWETRGGMAMRLRHDGSNWLGEALNSTKEQSWFDELR